MAIIDPLFSILDFANASASLQLAYSVWFVWSDYMP
jgi:hypothetical protein